jgi:3-methyladenine DNA glycosylase AlkD
VTRKIATTIAQIDARFAELRQSSSFAGIRSPQLIALSAELYSEVRNWTTSERNELCTLLWKRKQSEYGGLVCYLYRRFAHSFAEAEFLLFEFWLNRYASNWGHCDGISIYLLAPAIANVPGLAEGLRSWTHSPNRWMRRGAAAGLVKEAKHGHHTELIFDIASALAHDPEDLVQKGVGWLLKEAYPARPREVVEFLKRRRDWPRLVLRYAAEKMTAQDKARIL